MTINDFSLGDKFQYLGREAMRVPLLRYRSIYPINAIDIKTGSPLYISGERELRPIEYSFSYMPQDFTVSFSNLFIGDAFLYGNKPLIKCISFIDSKLDRTDAFCLEDGRACRILDDEEIHPLYIRRKEYSR